MNLLAEETEEEIKITPPRRGRPPKVGPKAEEESKEIEKLKAEVVKSADELKEEIIIAQKEIEDATKDITKLEKAKGVPDDLRECIKKIKIYKSKYESLNKEYIPENHKKYAIRIEYKRLWDSQEKKRKDLILKYGRSRAIVN